MTDTLKLLTYHVDDSGIARATFEPEEFKRYIRDNPDATVAVQDIEGNVIGILRTRPIWERLFSEISSKHSA
jgi:hypothetical protein